MRLSPTDDDDDDDDDDRFHNSVILRSQGDSLHSRVILHE